MDAFPAGIGLLEMGALRSLVSFGLSDMRLGVVGSIKGEKLRSVSVPLSSDASMLAEPNMLILDLLDLSEASIFSKPVEGVLIAREEVRVGVCRTECLKLRIFSVVAMLASLNSSRNALQVSPTVLSRARIFSIAKDSFLYIFVLMARSSNLSFLALSRSV